MHAHNHMLLLLIFYFNRLISHAVIISCFYQCSSQQCIQWIFLCTAYLVYSFFGTWMFL